LWFLLDWDFGQENSVELFIVPIGEVVVAHNKGVLRVRVYLFVLNILLLKVPHPLGAFGAVFIASVELSGPL
jgi:hypothetical protein